MTDETVMPDPPGSAPKRTGWRKAGRIAMWVGLGVLGFLVVVVLGLVLVPPIAKPYTDRWGATQREVAMALPGDEYVTSPTLNSTKAIAIKAPPQLVYKLLLQMGYRRGGWYGWDWFYKATGSDEFVGGSHAATIVPVLQRLQVGEVMAINTAVGYRVTELSVPNEAKPGWMLLEGAMGPGTPVGNDAITPKTTNMSWVWFVYPARDGTTRLVLRTRSGGASQGAFADWLYANPLDFGGAVFGYKTMAGIKRTAEKLAAEGVQ
jgi:hypothetical protein